MVTPEELEVRSLGPAGHASPLRGDKAVVFIDDANRVRYQRRTGPGIEPTSVTFEDAGARECIFFDPARTTAAVVTCGGLSPGLNNVIRGIVSEPAWFNIYSVDRFDDLMTQRNPLIAGMCDSKCVRGCEWGGGVVTLSFMRFAVVTRRSIPWPTGCCRCRFQCRQIISRTVRPILMN